VIGHEELRTIVARYSHTAGFDVDELSARPSWSVAVPYPRARQPASARRTSSSRYGPSDRAYSSVRWP
jgi:hypothetical protein